MTSVKTLTSPLNRSPEAYAGPCSDGQGRSETLEPNISFRGPESLVSRGQIGCRAHLVS
jgi:hypothetical protein